MNRSLLLFLFAAACTPARADVAKLVVHVVGLRNDVGTVKCLLFDTAEGFPDDPGAATASVIAEIDGSQCNVVVEDLPYGMYAVSILHDEDGDGKMKTGLFGIPKEGYGFSGDVVGRFGPPEFRDARFEVVSPEHSITVTVRY